MRHFDIGQLFGAVPVVQSMTRREKLLHWADLIRRSKRDLGLYHALEYMSVWQRQETKIGHNCPTALGVAASDPVLQAQGLNEGSSIEEALRFFELSMSQAHAFSCDCGGMIDNEHQAARIERLA